MNSRLQPLEKKIKLSRITKLNEFTTTKISNKFEINEALTDGNLATPESDIGGKYCI